MKEYTISSRTKKKKSTTSQATSSTLHLEGWTRCFRHRHSIKLSKNKMNAKVIKFHQCSLERCHAVLIELSYKF